jgi:hypothetical protein
MLTAFLEARKRIWEWLINGSAVGGNENYLWNYECRIILREELYTSYLVNVGCFF